MKTLFVLFIGFTFLLSYAQNPPGVSAEGNQNLCGNNPMFIATSADISNANGTEGNLDELFIQIATGYNIGFDSLNLTGTHANITASWSISEGLLTLTGPATFTEFENAITSIVYNTTSNNFTQDKQFSINLGNANYLPSTGHYYRYVADLGISWTDAKAAAESLTFFGLQGYLATITSDDEAQITGAQSAGTGWIGGSDQQQEGTWIWETGPEQGQIFWQGSVSGNAPNGAYAFWNTGEPNNFGDEDYAHITDPNIGLVGSWNDLPNQGNDPSSLYYPKGYIVEFGGLDGEPQINVSASTVIVTPKTSFNIPSVCDEGTITIQATSNTEQMYWFNSETATTPIHTGFNLETHVTQNTTFWAMPVFDGCTQGRRIPVTVSVYRSPEANDITIFQCDDEVQDGITSFNLNQHINSIIAGNESQPLSNLQVIFFENSALDIPITQSNNYQNTENLQIIYALITNTYTQCTDVAQITLQVGIGNEVEATIATCDDFVVDGYVTFNLNEANTQILNNLPLNATVAYYDTYENALLETNALPEQYFNTQAYQQIIYARVNLNGSCYAIGNVTLVVKDVPNVLQYEEVYYCTNTFPNTITLQGGVLDNIPNYYAYNWSNGETTINIEVNQTGTYTVFVTQPAECTNRRTIKVLPSNTATIEGIEITDVSENNTITVLFSGDGDYTYALDNENGVYQTSNTFYNVTAGEHTVYIKDEKGNCGITSEAVSVIGFPKYFTPNGDNINDFWQIKGFSARFPNTATIYIFNRFGKLITTLNQANPSWDGTYNGQALPTADYWFLATLQDGRQFKGHFTLKR